jgi:hypothetical protein
LTWPFNGRERQSAARRDDTRQHKGEADLRAEPAAIGQKEVIESITRKRFGAKRQKAKLRYIQDSFEPAKHGRAKEGLK